LHNFFLFDSMHKALYIFIVLIIPSSKLIAQYDSAIQFKLTGYLESYYLHDPYQPANSESYPEIFYNYHRSGEAQVNLALIKGSLKAQRIRSNFGIMTGSYADKNLAHEPIALRNIYEANAGIALDKRERIWLDIGVFESHLGSETPIGIQSPTLSRSLFAESSPYYLAGVKMSYQPKNEKWNFSLLHVNGWQKMYRPNSYSPLQFGTQIQWKPQKNITINHSTFIGSDKPDSSNITRFFNDLYVIWKWSDKWKFHALFDIGMDQTINHNWFTANLSIQHQFKPKWSCTIRAEYFEDPKEIIIQSPPQTEGFKTYSTSLNIDYKIIKQAMFRLESKFLTSTDYVFQKNEQELSNGALLFYASLCILID